MEKNNIKSIIKPRERYTEISSGDMTRVAGVSKETTNSKIKTTVSNVQIIFFNNEQLPAPDRNLGWLR